MLIDTPKGDEKAFAKSPDNSRWYSLPAEDLSQVKEHMKHPDASAYALTNLPIPSRRAELNIAEYILKLAGRDDLTESIEGLLRMLTHSGD